jgi:hypothetical protein
MPENPPPAPRRPGWKTAAPASGEHVRRAGWHQDPRRDEGGSGRRLWWVAAAVLALVILAVAFVYVATWLRQPGTVGIVLIGTPYDNDTALPANYYGWRGLLDLKCLAEKSERGGGWFGLSRRFRLLRDQLHPATTADDLLPEPGGVDTVLVFVSLHGGADEQGPFLFLDNPAGFVDDRSKARLPVAKLLDQLADGPWKSKKKIVAFDATQLSSCWQRGVLRNDFVAGLRDLLKSRNDQNLAVLCASDAGQRSWCSGDWQKTAFAHYLIDGLNGKADVDEEPPGVANKDTRVSLQELAGYVEYHVADWALGHRTSQQKPILLLGGGTAAGYAADLQLVLAEQVELPRAASPDLDTIQKAWDACDQLRETRKTWLVAYAPHLWKLYLDTLLRYEQAVLTGCTDEAAGLEKKLSELKEQLEQEAKITFADETLKATSNAFPMPGVYGPQAPPNRERLKDLWQQLTGMSAAVGREQLDKFANGLHSDEPRPAEVHLTRMLAKDLPPAPGGKIPATLANAVARAVDVRLQAERAALSAPADAGPGAPTPGYAEAVLPRVRGKVDDGDVARRRGEDLLFATEERHWNDALKHLSDAGGHYDAACRDAATLRAAFAARDRAMAELPYYGRWLADAPPGPNAAGDLKTVAATWTNAHGLADLLAEGHLDASLSEIARLAAEVEKGLRKLAGDADAYRRHLAQDNAFVQEAIRQLDHALQLPFIPAGDRRELLGLRREVALKLHDPNLQHAGRGEAVGEPDRSRDVAGLAEAVLGPRLPHAVGGLLDAGRTAEAGRLLADDWRDRIKFAREHLRKSLDESHLDIALREALLADEAVRQLDSSAAVALDTRPGTAKAARRLQTVKLLRWLAERTKVDHWYDENGPWYVAQAKHYLDDARTLAPSGREDRPKSDAERQNEISDRVEKTELGPLKLSDSPPLPPLLTKLHRNGEIRWSVSVPKDESVGDPVLWIERAAELDPGNADHEPPVSRPERENRLQARPGALALNLEKIADRRVPDDLESVNVTLKGFYRGQRLELLVRVPVEMEPEIRVRRIPPRGAALAVLEKGNLEGSLAVVLDGSASMGNGDAPVYNRNTECKYHTATEALRKGLEILPESTKLSVWLFGQRDQGKMEIWRDFGPVVYKLDGNTLEKLKDLDAFEPKAGGNSPVVRSMVEALRNDLVGERGIKALLVITDGDDNDLNGDIRQHLTDNFKNSNVAVRIVLIAVNKKDREQLPVAIKQFECIKDFYPGGELFILNEPELTRNTARNLQDYIEKALTHRVDLVRNRRRVKIDNEDGLRTSRSRLSLIWGGKDGNLQPETYEAQAYGLRTRLRLNEGDRLLLGLRQTPDRSLALGRLVVADELGSALPAERRCEAGDWVAAALLNRYKDGDLRQILSLECRPDTASTTIGQVQPRCCWIEAEPQSRERSAGRLEIQRDYEFPAPAFHIRRTKWPRDVRPRVSVWRRDAIPEGGGTLQFDLAQEFGSKTVKIGDQDVHLERLAVPNRSVVVAPSGAKESHKCLVLNATSPKGHRVLALPVEDDFSGGEEHCYYERGGVEHYEAVFWGDEFRTLSVRLVALDDFKRGVKPIQLNLDLPGPDDRQLIGPVSVGARLDDAPRAAKPAGGK